MWFLARFLASQAEMLAIILNFWKPYYSKSVYAHSGVKSSVISTIIDDSTLSDEEYFFLNNTITRDGPSESLKQIDLIL
jgi:hypothetical protein